MSSFKVEPKIVNGISVDIPNSVQLLSNTEVIYPSGGLLTIYNISDNSQKFLRIKKNPEKVINLISVHPKKSFIALSCSAPKPKIEIYQLSTLTLETTIPVVAPLITMCYTWDGSHLLYVTSEADPVMCYYSFELEKVENSTLATQPPAYLGPVTMIAGNTADSMIVVIVGNGLFRLLNLSDSIWRQYGFKKAEQYKFVSVCWISTERVVAGTSDGRIILVDSGELKALYKVYDTDIIALAATKEQLQVMMMSNLSSKGTASSPLKAVVSIIAFSNGFGLVICSNIVIIFEKESNSKYVKKFEFYTSGDQIKNDAREELDTIFSITISPDEKRLICCTFRGMLFSASLLKDQKSKGKVAFEPLDKKLHYGEIRTLATCAWKPLMMTSGSADRKVCLFNYEKNKLVFSQKFNNDIHSLTMHPTGLFCIIAFTDVCQIAYIMIDRLELGKKISSQDENKEYSPLRSCKVMEFSLYGTMLAVADGVQIKLYEHIQYHLLFTLLGHRIQITSFKWALQDDVLLSCGLDGAVYMWNPKHGKRTADIVTRNCQYHDIEATSDGDLIYTVAEDGHLREIKNEVVIQDLEVTSCSLSRIVMSRNDQICVISDQRGLVLVVDYPFVQKVDFNQYCVHTTTVTQMKMTYDNTCLITCDKNGMMCFWQFLNADGVELTPPKNLYRCDDVFVSEEELLELTTKLNDVQERINEIEFEHNFKLNELHKAYDDKMTKMKTEKLNTISILSEKMILLEMEKELEVANLNREKKEIRENFEKELDAVEKHLKYNLYVRECERNQKLEIEKEEALESYKVEKMAIEEKQKEELLAMKTKFEETLRASRKESTKLQDKLQQEIKNQEIMKELVENGADRTIIEIQKLYEGLIEEETKNYRKLKQNVGVCREEIKEMETELELAKNVKSKLEESIRILESQNFNSEARIEELLKEIIERDNILIPKERRVHQMKTRAEGYKQELQILKMRNEEVERAMKPKDDTIEELDTKIEAYKGVVFEKEHEIKQLEMKTKRLLDGIQAKDKEHQKNNKKQHELQSLLYMIKNDIYDIHESMKNLSEAELKQATKKIYEKYVADKTIEKMLKEFRKVGSENIRQYERLENTIEALDRQLTREKAVNSGKNCSMGEHIKSYNFHNSLLRKNYIFAASITGTVEHKSGATDEQIRTHTIKGRKQLQTHYNEKEILGDGEFSDEEFEESKRNLDDLEILQKESVDKLTEEPIVIPRENVKQTVQRNREVHEECQDKIMALEETNRKLHNELFELQKQIFYKKKQELDSKGIAKKSSHQLKS